MSEKKHKLWNVRLFLSYTKRFFYVVLALMVIEAVGCLFLPHVLPDSFYLWMYLPWQSVVETERFLDGRLDVELDPVLGWRNRPSNSVGMIEHDQYGARYTKPVRPERETKWRVALLGNSLIHGWTHVRNDQTIDAYMRNDEVEAFNLAVKAYQLDQCYLAMEKAATTVRPNVVVIGLDTAMAVKLDRHFMSLAFPSKREYGVLFLKPRFIVEGDQLRLEVPPYRQLLTGLPWNTRLVDYLKENDPYYYRFEAFKRWETTPMLNLLVHAVDGVQYKLFLLRYRTGWGKPVKFLNWRLARLIIKQSQRFADEKDIRLVYLLFPNLSEVRGVNKMDYAYDEFMGFLASQNIAALDLRGAFRAHDGDPADLYTRDHLHLNHRGDRVIARTINDWLATLPDPAADTQP